MHLLVGGSMVTCHRTTFAQQSLLFVRRVTVINSTFTHFIPRALRMRCRCLKQICICGDLVCAAARTTV